MDFLKLIRSFEELLFEVMSWFIYFPRTLWLTFRHPLRMIDYSDHELKEGIERQYTDTLSPPLLLLITLVLIHVTELSLDLEHLQAGSAAVRSFLSSDQNLIILRSLMFGLLPLFAALCYVRQKGLSLARQHLRPPFFGQCYLAATYALLISLSYIVSGQLFAAAAPIGAALAVGSTAWYISVQTLQYKHSLPRPLLSAAGLALWVFIQAVFCVAIIGFLIAGRGGAQAST